MSINSDNQLKFEEGKTTEPLTIINAGVEELPFGSKMVVHIKQTIEGYDHFLPSPGLEKKIKEENVDVDDVITIEKAAKTDKYPYGYFSVNVVEKNTTAPTHKSIEKFEEQFEPKDDKMEKHELILRVEKLEKITSHLWKWYQGVTAEKGHQPGDESFPF